MYDWTQGRKLKYLMDRGSPYQPGVKLSPWHLERGIKARTGGPTLSWRFLDYVLRDQKRITSLEKLELLATHFDVPVAFFAESPEQWLPPVSPKLFQMAVSSDGQVTADGLIFLAELAARAVTLTAAPPEQDRSQEPG